jgi:hypothetical protein
VASAEVPPQPPAPGRSVPLARVLSYLHRHPIVCLALMTPGFAEYVSGSSPLADLLLNPAWFALQLTINVAMYTSGALLIREAMIRWDKGWPTAFALGAAYAIMEEGIADNTIFTPAASHAPLGAAGVYGYFGGIDWTWLPDVFVIHILMSLTVPIVLLGYILPETRGKSLLTGRRAWVVLAILALDTAVLAGAVVGVTHYFYGPVLLGASLVAILLFCLLGRRLPKGAFAFRHGAPTGSRRQFYLVGALTYPLMVLAAVVGAGYHLYPPLVFLAIAGIPTLAFLWFVRNIGTERNERQVIAFTFGVLTIGFVLGVVLEFPVEIVAAFDAAIIYGLYRLDRHFAQRDAPVALPADPRAVPA